MAAAKKKATKKPVRKAARKSSRKPTAAQKAARFKSTRTPKEQKEMAARAKLRKKLVLEGTKAARAKGIKDSKKVWAFVKKNFLQPKGFATGKRKSKKK